MPTGIYETTQKNGTVSFRSSFTYHAKHISLGSFSIRTEAEKAYQTAVLLLRLKEGRHLHINDYSACGRPLPYDKWICLINLRDNGIYIKTPIYLLKRYFIYHLDEETQLKFDVDDLFYYSNHKIMRRGGHLFVADFGMQVSLISRYGIKPFAVAGRDFFFANGDATDFRYGNIELVNRYFGVRKQYRNGVCLYIAKIHINGDIIIGRYAEEIDAALVYNKAADCLRKAGLTKNYQMNYIDSLTETEQEERKNELHFSPGFKRMLTNLSKKSGS